MLIPHHQRTLLTMLNDGKKNARDQATQIIMKIKKAASPEENPKCSHVRRFVIPPVDCKATAYYKVSTLSTTTISEPPAIRDKSTLAIKAFAEN